ncbi:MAG: ABC transporter substrate-binding protein [Spirochaetaceae bacterium]|nr:ABC transporter substrate-binding protein [Spirochaetaceae bacterium]
MNNSKFFESSVAIALLVVSLAGCGRQKADADSASQELIVAGNEIAVGFDPTVYPGADYLLNMGAAEILFKADADGQIQPFLAKQAAKIDAYTWLIELRPEARFWSGVPVTAEAVIGSLERSRKLDMKAYPYLEGIAFTAVSDYAIQAKTEYPNMDITKNLSNAQLVIHNTDARYTYTSIDTADYTGMYKIAEFIPHQKMVFAINENYWGQKPEIPRVVHEEISDGDARSLAALSGRYHVVMNIPFTAIEQFRQSSVAHISAVPAANTQTIYLNLDKSQLQDKRVRQALSWGLNRDELIRLGEEGLGTPVTTWLGSNPAYSEIRTAYFETFDADRAAKLLDEAGWALGADGYRYKNGKQLAMFLRTFRNDKALGESIQIQWSRLGVNVKVQHGDYSLIQTARETGDWDASIEAWGTFGNVSSQLKGQYAPEGAANYGGFNDEQTNQLLDLIAGAAEEDERHDLAVKLSMHIADLSPAIYLCPRPELTAVNNSLAGFVPHFRQFENVVNAGLRIGSQAASQ